jgi:hypothetical protein
MIVPKTSLLQGFLFFVGVGWVGVKYIGSAEEVRTLQV